MTIFNQTKKTTISDQVVELVSFFDRTLGLHKYPTKALFFYTRFGIHTFFLKKNIDIIIISDTNIVVKLGIGIKPNSIFLWSLQYEKVIELPQGSILTSKTTLGDGVIFE